MVRLRVTTINPVALSLTWRGHFAVHNYLRS
nr:MAG TPA: hypothetical protein [Caudoviricetes sp.]